MTMWCKHCKRNRDTYTDESTSSVCCGECGRVISQEIYSDDVQYIKGSDGQSQAQGSFRNFKKDLSESLERSINNGRYAICKLSSDLDMNNGSLETQAESFYKVAAERGFTRGRRTDQVAAACLYTACRANDKPYLLIDFSEKLAISVYRLGSVYVPLCELLRFTEHDFYRKPVDPSLFIDLFTERLHGVGNKAVSRTALRIVSSMKRDWMQTGRKPSGLCGAALYISSLSHGFKYSKSDVAKVVHMGPETLSKRLIEFGNTDSGGLTYEEFNEIADEHEKNVSSGKSIGVSCKSSEAAELLCRHKGSSEQAFAHGLCRSCYEEFIEISGGLDGGLDPPAFQQAERVRTALLSAEKTVESDVAVNMPGKDTADGNHLPESHTAVDDLAKANQNVKTTGDEGLVDSEKRNAAEHEIRDDNTFDMSDQNEAVNPEEEESVDLSDIDDIEVSGYLNNKEEIHLKTIIWEVMNKEYLEEQAIKEAAAAAIAAEMADLPEDMRAAHELSAAAAAAVAKSRKERQQKRAADAKNATPAQTAAEATRQMLAKKRLSSKINYDVLEKLFDGDDVVSESKKSKVESQDGVDSLKWDHKEKEHKGMSTDNADEFELGNDSDYLGDEMEDEQESYNGNEEDNYDFDADNGSDDY